MATGSRRNYLTEYLLKHGAVPKVRLFDEWSVRQDETFLADHMSSLLEDARGKRARNAEAIDKLLSDYGQI